MRTWSTIVAAATAGCMLTAASAASAADIVVVSAGAVKEVLDALIPQFERASGHKVTISFQSTAAVIAKMKDGASADLVFAPAEAVDEIIKAGKITGTRSDFIKSGTGVAVKAGAPKPDIGTPAAFKSTLLAAKSLAYSRGPSGQYFASVLERLGIAEQMKPKSVLIDGGPVGVIVAKGDAEIGVQQIAELLPVPGITYRGAAAGRPAEADRVFGRHLGQRQAGGRRQGAHRLLEVRGCRARDQAEGHGARVTWGGRSLLPIVKLETTMRIWPTFTAAATTAILGMLVAATSSGPPRSCS